MYELYSVSSIELEEVHGPNDYLTLLLSRVLGSLNLTLQRVSTRFTQPSKYNRVQVKISTLLGHWVFKVNTYYVLGIEHRALSRQYSARNVPLLDDWFMCTLVLGSTVSLLYTVRVISALRL